jgi:hypothetical protein
MYDFLPTDKEVMKKQYQGVTYAVLMFKTKKVFDNILWWWFLCSLNLDCMAPILHLGCKFDSEDRMRTFAHCHRFDQSATNILAAISTTTMTLFITSKRKPNGKEGLTL